MWPVPCRGPQPHTGGAGQQSWWADEARWHFRYKKSRTVSLASFGSSLIFQSKVLQVPSSNPVSQFTSHTAHPWGPEPQVKEDMMAAAGGARCEGEPEQDTHEALTCARHVPALSNRAHFQMQQIYAAPKAGGWINYLDKINTLNDCH